MVDQLFYVSAATHPHDDSVVREILSEARKRNPKRDVTGCLLYSGKCFGQVLEARAEVIDDMIGSLSNDPRHCRMKIVSRLTCTIREYGDWTMGYMHSLELQDALQSLIDAHAVDDDAVQKMRQSIRPDPLTGLA